MEEPLVSETLCFELRWAIIPVTFFIDGRDIVKEMKVLQYRYTPHDEWRDVPEVTDES